MKASTHTNSTGLRIRAVLRRLPALVSAASAAFLLTGCLQFSVRHTKVDQTTLAPHVMDATLDQLNSQTCTQYTSIKTLNAKVNIQATSGGARQGEKQEYPALSGYILVRKPHDLRAILTLPVFGSLAMDMVSDGKTFKLVAPSKKIAREGSEEVTKPSPKGFENLRPNIIREALLVPCVGTDELVSLTQDARMIPAAAGKKGSTEVPDYDLAIVRLKTGNELQTERVIHIDRTTLEPYEQDIYDPAGRLVTVVLYSNYQKSGGIPFPMSILITRPIDEYKLKIDIVKLTLNQEMDDEQFVLKFPDGIPVQKMDDVSAIKSQPAAAQPAAHASGSQR
jgi:outer membrane lipoprotein-sorting protein